MARAADQFGVVARWQLEADGVPEWLIDGWVRRRLLHDWHRGVYAVGHRALGVHGRRLAAVLACGEEAGLWERTAADHLGIKANASGTVHVWVPNQQGRRVDGIQPHRHRDVLPEDFEVVGGIRTATPMRVIVDLAPRLTLPRLRAAIDATENAQQFDLATLTAIMDRRPRRPGTRALKEVLATYTEALPTLTELEERGVDLIRRAGLPQREAQYRTDVGRVDFYFPEARLILEMDSFRWHKNRHRFELDRERDAEHLAQGIATMRVTWHQAPQPQTEARLRRVYRNRAGRVVP